uniref:Uncharacterized protein n=1 Tax=Arundo donax TaxID=35708 RepID=A0A0A9CJ12_ARUDO
MLEAMYLFHTYNVLVLCHLFEIMLATYLV